MRRFLTSWTVLAGLALFTMLFGASNVIGPLQVGLNAGGHFGAAMGGFLLTAALLPFLGMLAILLFDGDYRRFFWRLGPVAGTAFLAACFLVIGPLLGIPRIVTLTYELISPLLAIHSAYYSWVPAGVSVSTFALVYLGLNVIGALFKDRLLVTFGYFVSPFLLACIGFIVFSAVVTPGASQILVQTRWQVFAQQFEYGFHTLDLLAAIFFGALLVNLLKRAMHNESRAQVLKLIFVGFGGGLLACVLLALTYLGLGLVGYLHSAQLAYLHDASLVRSIIVLFAVHKSIWTFFAVFCVCYTTSVALLIVFAQYLQVMIFNNRIGYFISLLLSAALSFVPCYVGFELMAPYVIGPVTCLLYPAIITLVLCNMGYKVWGMRAVKWPVALTLFAACVLYAYRMLT